MKFFFQTKRSTLLAKSALLSFLTAINLCSVSYNTNRHKHHPHQTWSKTRKEILIKNYNKYSNQIIKKENEMYMVISHSIIMNCILQKKLQQILYNPYVCIDNIKKLENDIVNNDEMFKINMMIMNIQKMDLIKNQNDIINSFVVDIIKLEISNDQNFYFNNTIQNQYLIFNMFATIQTLLNSINNISTNQKLTNLEYFIQAVVKTTKAHIYLFQMNNNQLNNMKKAQQNYTEAIKIFYNLLNHHSKQITINEAQIILEILKHVIQTQNTLSAARSIQYN